MTGTAAAEPGRRAVRRVLVVGYGYAGSRFIRAIRYLQEAGEAIDLVGACDTDADRLSPLDGEIRGYTSVSEALAACRPDVVCVTVSERLHSSVLAHLGGSEPLTVLCEKPLTATPAEAVRIKPIIARHQFSINMVEHFSPIVREVERWLDAHPDLRPERVEFFWGKHRIRDPRPTIGVTSELTHPVGLVERIFGISEFHVRWAHGTAGHLGGAHGPALDSVDLVADAGGFPVVGHASFAWPRRNRTIVALLSSAGGEQYRVMLEFDCPQWDDDRLMVERIGDDGRYHVVKEVAAARDDLPASIQGVAKVTRFIQLSLRYGGSADAARHGLVELDGAMRIQRYMDAVTRAGADRTVTRVD